MHYTCYKSVCNYEDTEMKYRYTSLSISELMDLDPSVFDEVPKISFFERIKRFWLN